MTKFKKRLIFFLFLIPIYSSLFAAEHTATDTIEGFSNIESYSLKNGMKVVLWPDSSARQVGGKIWYKVGALQEKPGVTGIAHLLEHMLFRPSKFAPEGGISFEKTLGASLGATTKFKTTDFNVTLGEENLEHILRYYADIMKNLTLDKKMLSNEKEAVRSEYLNWDNNPVMILVPQLTKNLYPGHIAENFITGKRKDLNKITDTDLINFYRKYYSPNNAVLVITGNFNTDKVVEWVENYFEKIEKGSDAIIPNDLVKLPPQKIIKVPTPGDSYPVIFSYSLPFKALSAKEDSALKLAFTIAFGGKASLVGDELINRRKFASDVEFSDEDLGFKFALFNLLGNSGEVAIKAADEAVNQLQRLDEARYGQFAFASQANLLRNLQSPTQRAHVLGYYLTYYHGIESLKTDLQASKMIPLSLVKEIAKKYLDQKNRIAVLAQPSRGKK